MADGDGQIELKQVVGALVFAARQSLSVPAIRKILQAVAQGPGDTPALFTGVTDKDITAALAQIGADAEQARLGFYLAEGSDGFYFQSDATAGVWVRHLLDAGKPVRLSRPALETLAIIAYRQPITRAEIEGVRGVTVDHVIRVLMELQLVRIVGRSELPGRPLLYGTTGAFLEHFGLKGVKELPAIEELSRLAQPRQAEVPAAPAADAAEPAVDAAEPAAVTPAAEEPEAGATAEAEQGNHEPG